MIRPHQNEYEQYMKDVVDKFETISLYDKQSNSTESINKYPSISKYIFDLDGYLFHECSNVRQSWGGMNNGYEEYKHDLSLKFLNEHSLTYQQFVNKYYNEK